MRDAEHDRFLRSWTQARPALAGWVTAVLPDQRLADAVLQQIEAAALRGFPAFDPTRPFVAWAMGIATTHLVTARREHARASARLGPQTIAALAQTWEADVVPELDQRRRALDECLGRVTGRSRELVALRYDDALEPKDIAERMRMNAGAVRVASARVRAALQACIERRLKGAP